MIRKICLLAEDDREDQEFFSTTLKKVSPDTLLVIAPDAESAIKMLRAEKTPDFIVIDIFLPGMDGYELLLHLKRDIRHRKIPVLILSSLKDETEIQKLKKFGALEYLAKSADTAQLEEVLMQLTKND